MKKTVINLIVVLSLVASLALSFGAGYIMGGGISLAPGEGLDVIEQAWNIIFRDYVDRDRLDARQLSQAAIEGMVEVMDDPYTSYLDAEAYQLSSTSIEGEFEGIGAHVTIKDGELTIVAPIADSPADKAGIRAGDVILEVDGQPTAEMSLAEAVLKIRGAEGTTVRLLVRHQGDTEPEEIEIVRAKIELPSIRYEMRGDVAYISITHFSKRTSEELSPVLESITQQQAAGIILDLRHNPGGSLEAVVDVASRFLAEGVVVSVEDNQKKRTPIEVEPNGMVIDLPMVVLVDNYSASGSEVLAGALQDYGRATIAGTKTYGKGSVNILRRLKDGSGLYITTARWLTPSGRRIEGEGLSPDYELELVGEDAIQWAIAYLRHSGVG